eukprot:TRINITY_DN95_c0_g1_i5.p1 TRINITY_DN95_c0_g1~~TRINITY_DN95_c0_g1_i5.p1  ORF type:complete len:120 (-),score=53.32 TRINITY_DN95_c0_g1_i5:160-519(-)
MASTIVTYANSCSSHHDEDRRAMEICKVFVNVYHQLYALRHTLSPDQVSMAWVLPSDELQLTFRRTLLSILLQATIQIGQQYAKTERGVQVWMPQYIDLIRVLQTDSDPFVADQANLVL